MSEYGGGSSGGVESIQNNDFYKTAVKKPRVENQLSILVRKTLREGCPLPICVPEPVSSISWPRTMDSLRAHFIF